MCYKGLVYCARVDTLLSEGLVVASVVFFSTSVYSTLQSSSSVTFPELLVTSGACGHSIQDLIKGRMICTELEHLPP